MNRSKYNFWTSPCPQRQPKWAQKHKKFSHFLANHTLPELYVRLQSCLFLFYQRKIYIHLMFSILLTEKFFQFYIQQKFPLTFIQKKMSFYFNKQKGSLLSIIQLKTSILTLQLVFFFCFNGRKFHPMLLTSLFFSILWEENIFLV